MRNVMEMGARTLTLSVLGLLVLSCEHPTDVMDVDEVQVPPELGRDSVVVGDPVFYCLEWRDGFDPPAGRMIVDLFFGRAGPEAPPDKPLEEHLSAVRERGGRIMHTFNFPAVRADIPSESVEKLAKDFVLDHARLVPYSDRFDWPVAVGYDHFPTQEDLETFASVGGFLTHVFLVTPMIAGDLPDSSFPTLRAMPGVQFVEADALRCR